MPDLVSVKDKLKKAQPQRRTFRMNLRGDIVASIQELEQTLEDLRERELDSSAQRRLGGPDTRESTAVARRIKDLEAEMEDGWLDLVLEAQPWADWRDFKLSNPPDEDDQQDKNSDFHFSALIESDLLKKCVVEPELDAEDWDMIFRVCAPADLRELGLNVYVMHDRSLDIPKSLRASVVLAQNDPGSKSPEPGESASDGSTAGSPESSTSTSVETESPAQPETPTSP